MGLASTSARDAWIGRTLGGRYRVLRPLGEGGLGCVYLAEHLTLGRTVALKMLHPHLATTPTLRQRFEREARALSRLSHPNVVCVVDFGNDDDALYLVMELVEGETLVERMRTEPPTVGGALEIMRQIIRALAYAHTFGIVHRDLKPGNVLVRTLPDGVDHITVLDFGLAKFLDEENAGVITRNGAVLGTPAYMAPEQAMGDTANASADVYAATLILFELLTGRRPFPGSEPSELFRAHLLAPIPLLAEVHPELGVSAEIDALIQRGLDKTASRRFSDAREMLVAFDAVPELAGRKSLAHASGAITLDSIAPVSSSVHRALITGHDSIMLASPVEPLSAVSYATPASHVGAAESSRVEPAPRTPRRALAWVVALCAISLAAFVLAAFVQPFRSWFSDDQTSRVRPGPTPASPAVPTPSLPSRVPQRDPWIDALPPELATLHGAISRGAKPPRSALQPLYRHASTHRSDARGLLLLGRTYADRGWNNDAMNAYRDAYVRDPSSRGDPRMLSDLLAMASLERFDVKARGYVVEWYGPEALPSVAARIAQCSDPHVLTLLERLRTALLAAQ